MLAVSEYDSGSS